MYFALLTTHSIVRWLVVASLVFSLCTSIHGLITKRMYSKSDALARSIATTILHTQVLLGFILYFGFSPIPKAFIKNISGSNEQMWFFTVYHMAMMFAAVAVLTTGGSKAKRAATHPQKFKLTTIYFGIALVLIILAVPWFRPLLRNW